MPSPIAVRRNEVAAAVAVMVVAMEGVTGVSAAVIVHPNPVVSWQPWLQLLPRGLPQWRHRLPRQLWLHPHPRPSRRSPAAPAAAAPPPAEAGGQGRGLKSPGCCSVSPAAARG
jgi:hypothetical protein